MVPWERHTIEWRGTEEDKKPGKLKIETGDRKMMDVAEFKGKYSPQRIWVKFGNRGEEHKKNTQKGHFYLVVGLRGRGP